MTTTISRVASCISEYAGVKMADITPEKLLVADLGCDSIDLIAIVMAIEEEFDIILDDYAAESCATVADAVALVDRVTA